MQYTAHSVDDTRLFARQQALELTRQAKGQPLVIALEGELGAGKTTFVQAFSEALDVREKVKSPTFVLMKRYPLTAVPDYRELYHLDCYRLTGPAELLPLGINEIFKTRGDIILVEWAERVATALPAKHIVVHIDHVSEHVRNIHVSNK